MAMNLLGASSAPMQTADADDLVGRTVAKLKKGDARGKRKCCYGS